MDKHHFTKLEREEGGSGVGARGSMTGGREKEGMGKGERRNGEGEDRGRGRKEGRREGRREGGHSPENRKPQ